MVYKSLQIALIHLLIFRKRADKLHYTLFFTPSIDKYVLVGKEYWLQFKFRDVRASIKRLLYSLYRGRIGQKKLLKIRDCGHRDTSCWFNFHHSIFIPCFPCFSCTLLPRLPWWNTWPRKCCICLFMYLTNIYLVVIFIFISFWLKCLLNHRFILRVYN